MVSVWLVYGGVWLLGLLALLAYSKLSASDLPGPLGSPPAFVHSGTTSIPPHPTGGQGAVVRDLRRAPGT